MHFSGLLVTAVYVCSLLSICCTHRQSHALLYILPFALTRSLFMSVASSVVKYEAILLLLL